MNVSLWFKLLVIFWCLIEGCSMYALSNVHQEQIVNKHSFLLHQASQEQDKTIDVVFEKALSSYGKDYLEAEQKLRDGGEQAITVLRKNLQHADPVAQLIAKTLLNWIEGKAPENQKALDYLEYYPNRIARTPITEPSPTGIARYFNIEFGSKVNDILAVRLVKGTDWPHWKVSSVLFYLKEQKLSSTTSALIRFAAETNVQKWRGYAIEAIKATKDPDLRKKVRFEQKRMKESKMEFPKELQDLIN